MSKQPEVLTCDLCNKELTADDSWIGLNRWVVNCGGVGRMFSQERGYGWHPRSGTFTGRSLCFPYCAIKWLEGQSIEVAMKK